MKYNVTESKLKIYLAVKMWLALGKKEFMCLVVLETGTDNLAEDLSVRLYDLECLIKAWFGCFLSAKICFSSAFAASSLLCSSAGSVSLGMPMMLRLLFWTRWISFARYSWSPPHTGEAYSSSGRIFVQYTVVPTSDGSCAGSLLNSVASCLPS